MNVSPMLKRIIILATAFIIAMLIPPSHATEQVAFDTLAQVQITQTRLVETQPVELKKPA